MSDLDRQIDRLAEGPEQEERLAAALPDLRAASPRQLARIWRARPQTHALHRALEAETAARLLEGLPEGEAHGGEAEKHGGHREPENSGGHAVVVALLFCACLGHAEERAVPLGLDGGSPFCQELGGGVVVRGAGSPSMDDAHQLAVAAAGKPALGNLGLVVVGHGARIAPPPDQANGKEAA